MCLSMLDLALLWHYVLMIHWLVTPRYPGKGLGWDTLIGITIISTVIVVCATLGLLVLARTGNKEMYVARGREPRFYRMKQFCLVNLVSVPAAWILLGCIIGW